MPWLRIAYFEDFADGPNLLVAGDAEGFRRLTRVVRELSGVVDGSTDAASVSGVTVCGGITIILETSSTDEGLRSRGEGEFVWRRSPGGWTDVVEKLDVLAASSSAGHHYLDGPADEVQVAAAIGEYAEDWPGSSAR
jgi:hypothetical protein